MARFKNANWGVREAEGNKNSAFDCHEASLAVLMDIRDEMQRMNALLHCKNFLDIPLRLRMIQKNTQKRKRK